MRRQDIPRLVDEAVELVKTSQVVELEHGRVFSNYFAFLWPQIIDNEVLQKINGAGHQALPVAAGRAGRAGAEE